MQGVWQEKGYVLEAWAVAGQTRTAGLWHRPRFGETTDQKFRGRGFYKLLSQPHEGEGGQGASPQGRLDLGVANAITHLEFSLGDETGQRGQA